MLKTRVITALALGLALLASLFFLPAMAWKLFVALILGAAAWEWQRLAALPAYLSKVYAPATVVAFGAILYFEPLYLPILLVATAFWLIVVPCWLAFKWRLQALGNFNIVLGWFVLMPAGIAMVQLREQGPWVLFSAMAVAWIADSFAYFTGRLIGRFKLAPSISPGKTWEGVLGGLAAVLIYLLALLPTGQLMSSAALAFVLTAVSVIGDLLESLFKRQAGLKDSSNLLPGHGGVLDRIDSLLAILPVAAVVSLFPTLLNFR